MEVSVHMDGILLRNEREADFDAVELLTREAFWNRYVPGCNEHYLLHVMRHADSFIKELDFVAELNGLIVGNIVYTKAKLVEDSGKSHDVLSFGPLSVLPDFQGKGIGGMLITHTTALAKALGYKAIFIYGDPDYYCRFGFVAAKTYGIGTSDNMYAAALQALELVPGALSNISGRFFEDAVYDVDEAAAKVFDAGFPPKALRDDLPSQIKFLQMLEMCAPRA